MSSMCAVSSLWSSPLSTSLSSCRPCSSSFSSSSSTRSSWQTCTTPLRRVWTLLTSSPSPHGWYGMRDAGRAFECAVRDHFLDHDDFKQGMFSKWVFTHRSKFLLYFVHGDDYVGLGVEGYKAKLSERFIIKDRGILGADGLHEIRILNRVITYHPATPGCLEMLTHEADQRHADLLMAAYGLNVSSKGKPIPWDKANFLARHPLAGPFLDEKRRVEFRSNCMRCLYLALDRPDIQYTAKEISRAMASPTVHADETLKALWRYLASHPRVLWRYTAGIDGKSLGIDRFELGSLSGDSQEHFSDLSHAGKTSDLRSQLNTDNFKLVESFTEPWDVLIGQWGWRVSCRTCHWMSRQNR